MFLGRTPSFTHKAVDWTSERSASRGALQIPIKGAQGPERKPRRGVRFIVRPAPLFSFLLFFGGAARELLNHSMRLSPRRRKTKERGFGRDFYKQATPPGFALALRWLPWGKANSLSPEKAADRGNGSVSKNSKRAYGLSATYLTTCVYVS